MPPKAFSDGFSVSGRQVNFSEQYVVYCGQPFGLEGCDRGTSRGVVDFVNNVGLKLHEDYPHQDREDSCPYDFQLHPDVARGSYRMQFRKVYLFSRKMMPAMLTHSPVAVRLKFPPGLEFGGRVKIECSNEVPRHQMLKVGYERRGLLHEDQ